MSAQPSAAPRLTVLYVTYNLPPKVGGLEVVVLRTWQALGERAHVVTLAQGAAGCHDGDPHVHRPKREGLLPYFAFLYTRGRRIAARQHVDVVVSGSALTALPTVHLARRGGARSVVLIHGLDTIYPSWLYQRVYRYAMPKADLVVANSRATAAEAIARGVDGARVTVIPPGCDAAAFAQPRDLAAQRKAWGLRGAKVILSAGRVVRRKGVDRFVRECLPQVVSAVPEAKLLVAGGNPEGALVHTDDAVASVQRAVAEAGMGEHVVVTGRLSGDDMVAAFQLADVFVLPAVPVAGDMEGFGIVLLEAGAAGKPAVATRLGGITDAVVDGVTGALVAPCDYGAMAQALVAFLRDAELSRRHGLAARERVLTDFTWPVVGQRYFEAIARLCGREPHEGAADALAEGASPIAGDAHGRRA